jgi:hypothetical protein
MPDLILLFSRKWKFILLLTVLATLVALVVVLLSPKKYLSTATALPANSMMADKARIYNPNIEILYSDFGTPDELDRMEGTGSLDTIFIATAKEFDLAAHYDIPASGESTYKAAIELKKNSTINRSGYGELKIRVWDEDRNLAAGLANSLLQKIDELHQHIQAETNASVLEQLKKDHLQKEEKYRRLSDSALQAKGADAEIAMAGKTALLQQLSEDQKIMDQYAMAISTNPHMLLTVEAARPSIWPDKPRIVPTLVFTFFGALIFSFLLALFIDSRNKAV